MSNLVDFSMPQRQSLTGILVMFANSLQKSIRAFWPILILYFVKFESLNKFLFFGSIIGVLILIGFFSYLQYWFFTFHIDEETNEFVIQKGVLNKSKITIQLHKIQQVNINQSLIQRLVGVYKLEIDTAGSDKKEASISAISHQLATLLKERLIHYSEINLNSKVDTQSEDFEPVSFVKIGIVSLIKIGFTSNYVKSLALLFVFLTTIIENFNQFQNDIINEDKVTNYLESFPIITSVLMVVGFVFALVLIVNLVRTIFRYFDFTIQKNQQSVILSYGLLATKSILLNPNKVQIVKITQNYFQKKLDVTTIGVHQASSDAQKIKEKDKIEVPGCTQLESFEILKLLFSQVPKNGTLYLPNWRKLALNSFFFLLIPILIMLFLNRKTEFVTWTECGIYTTIFSVFAGIIIWFSFKNYKLFVSDDFIIKQNGAWDIDTSIIEPFKIQTIKTQQFFWQKYTNIGSVTLSTAGGNISFSTGNYSEIKQLVNYWLYQVETSEKTWM
ncbi:MULTISPECIES: PH domain-containing protein [unclassified Flavobacterium]|uniref:PH domain-containing protein n=1 Tax=unclassified Flavobacterium TaxID=196869 RepID=UPI001292771B|nr:MULTISPECIES: PH domain-containing protein [unclassified Flavobacterium]MQP52354.1 PH domain-containing protein [Flavobacterium sp. LMO9]MQP62424.1 PH domain-containing protein [Flavobacterium sp. LMO6]